MAPERPVMAPGRAYAPREVPRGHQSLFILNDLQQVETGAWPLPAKVVRQIQKQVAREGRTLQRLEVQGAVIDNLDTLDSESPGSITPPKYKTLHYDRGELYEDDNMAVDGTTTNIEVQMEDNDLTNLTWLQDRNLLRSINLSKGENDEMRPISVQISPQSGMSNASPTSDYLEESYTSELADSSGSDQIQLSPPHTPLPYSTHSRSSLGFDSPKSSPAKMKHPQNAPYNPLVHTESKPPYSFSCLIFMAIENSPAKALPVKEIYMWIMTNFPYFRNAPTGWKNSVRHNLSLNKCFQKVEKSPSLGKGSLWMVDDQYRSNLLQAFSRSPFHPCVPPGPIQSLPSVSSTSSSSSSSTPTSTTQSRLSALESSNPKGAPNPQLFPFLSRRLAASSGQQSSDSLSDALNGHESCDSLDEVVAAAMVLALKHGPGVIPPPLISSCPTQDHTYSAANGATMGSPEAGYASDEEQRKTAETLLHLAGMPPSPTYIPQTSHRPRLLRRAPKRPNYQQIRRFEETNQSNTFCSQSDTSLNNNHAGLADKNNPRTKKARLL